jgi:hypothetical protein
MWDRRLSGRQVWQGEVGGRGRDVLGDRLPQRREHTWVGRPPGEHEPRQDGVESRGFAAVSGTSD